MIFNSISLENFGIIKRFSKQFSKNILVLAGENGEGKSTVLKALLLAVFDDYENTLADYINWESDYFQIIVNFTHRGIDYEVTVRYDGSTDRTLRFGDKVLKGDEAKKKLKEAIDFDLLKAGMLAMEQKIAIVDTKPAERREYLKRIYDIEFKRQLADLDDDIKVSEVELAKKETLQTEIENRKYDVPEKPEFPFSKTDYDLFKANLEIERGKLHAAEERISAYERMKADYVNLGGQSGKLTVDIRDLSEKISNDKARLDALPELKNNAISTETASLALLENELVLEKSEFDKAHASLLTSFIIIVLERLPSFNMEEFTAVSQELYAKKSKLAELESAPKDICLSCGQEISAEHLAKRQKEISEITSQISELTAKFESISDIKFRREQAEKNNLEKTNRKTSLQHQLSLLEEKNKSECLRIQAKIDQVKNNLKNLDAKFEAEAVNLESLITVNSDYKENLKTQYDEVDKKREELAKKLEDTELPSQLDEIRIAVQRFEADIRQYDDIVSRISEIERMEKQIAIKKEQDSKQLEQVRLDIQVLNQLIGDWKAEIKILKTEFPVFVISYVIKDIEKSMNEFLKRTYPKYTVKVQDKKNALYIVYGPKNKDVGTASGFERQIFSLSFMYAISRAIGNRCLILDEADSASTEKNSGIFYRVLGDSIGQGIDQIILVSHKPSTRNILEFDYGAEVLTFEKGTAA